jgi:hypothetical protein
MSPIATAALRADLARDASPRREAAGALAFAQGVGSREETSVISASRQLRHSPIGFTVAEMYESSTGRSSWPWSSASRAGWSQGRACWRSASGGLQRPRRPAARSHAHQTLPVFNSWLQRSPEAQGLFPVGWGRRLSRVCQGWAGRPIAWGSSRPKELAEHPQAIDQWVGAATASMDGDSTAATRSRSGPSLYRAALGCWLGFACQ